MKVKPITMQGPDFYCPDCKRWLVTVHEDGSVDLAGKAAFKTKMVVGEEEGTGLIYEAGCLSRKCRFKRWLKRA